ncbi:hypothetical protein GP486_003427 [Trichoglossum hirsutum]|uniref:Protein kinase domain-containing protein n=1 Tax=Trichoglossum hirsutum TaxID=265104 RepID=A0A9P8RQQ2_9PEZI|nr:hypothetical protein GP486_003427 [Trichoglossum hirsutum]
MASKTLNRRSKRTVAATDNNANAADAPKQHRRDKKRAQNRISQQCKRERQASYIRQLERFAEDIQPSATGLEGPQAQLQHLQTKHSDLLRENQELREGLMKMRKKLISLGAAAASCAAREVTSLIIPYSTDDTTIKKGEAKGSQSKCAESSLWEISNIPFRMAGVQVASVRGSGSFRSPPMAPEVLPATATDLMLSQADVLNFKTATGPVPMSLEAAVAVTTPLAPSREGHTFAFGAPIASAAPATLGHSIEEPVPSVSTAASSPSIPQRVRYADPIPDDDLCPSSTYTGLVIPSGPDPVTSSVPYNSTSTYDSVAKAFMPDYHDIVVDVFELVAKQVAEKMRLSIFKDIWKEASMPSPVFSSRQIEKVDNMTLSDVCKSSTRLMLKCSILESSENCAAIPEPFHPTILQQLVVDRPAAIDMTHFGELRDQFIIYLGTYNLRTAHMDSIESLVREVPTLGIALPIFEFYHGLVKSSDESDILEYDEDPKAGEVGNAEYDPSAPYQPPCTSRTIQQARKYGFHRLHERKLGPAFAQKYPFLDVRMITTKYPIIRWEDIGRTLKHPSEPGRPVPRAVYHTSLGAASQGGRKPSKASYAVFMESAKCLVWRRSGTRPKPTNRHARALSSRSSSSTLPRSAYTVGRPTLIAIAGEDYPAASTQRSRQPQPPAALVTLPGDNTTSLRAETGRAPDATNSARITSVPPGVPQNTQKPGDGAATYTRPDGIRSKQPATNTLTSSAYGQALTHEPDVSRRETEPWTEGCRSDDGSELEGGGDREVGYDEPPESAQQKGLHRSPTISPFELDPQPSAPREDDDYYDLQNSFSQINVGNLGTIVVPEDAETQYAWTSGLQSNPDMSGTPAASDHHRSLHARDPRSVAFPTAERSCPPPSAPQLVIRHRLPSNSQRPNNRPYSGGLFMGSRNRNLDPVYLTYYRDTGLLESSATTSAASLTSQVLTQSPTPCSNRFPETIVPHREYKGSEDVPYEPIRNLGYGGGGFVEEVKATFGRAPVQGHFARKIIKIPTLISNQVRKRIENEVNIIKRLNHRHVVRVLATYSERRQFGIIMAPVAEMNLEEYFERNPEPALGDKMYTWFGCLVTGLDYLHRERIKHRDIKPTNILVERERILYTDFGISRDMYDEVTTSTTGVVDAKSPMYCSPEVATESRRGRSSDVFSLGCVFLEMVTVLMWDYGVSIEELHKFKQKNGKLAYSSNLDKTLEWILGLVARIKLRSPGEARTLDEVLRNDIHDLPCGERQLCFALEWCVAMLQPRRSDRASASRIAQLIQTVDSRQNTPGSLASARPWIGDCCRAPSERLPPAATTRIIDRWPIVPKPGFTVYLHFANDQRGVIREENPGITGERWSALDPTRRAYYEAGAKAEEERCMQEKKKYYEDIKIWAKLSTWDKANKLMGYKPRADSP